MRSLVPIPARIPRGWITIGANRGLAACVKPALIFRRVASERMVRAAQELLAPTPIQHPNRLHQMRDIMNKFAFLFGASLFLASTAHAEGF